MNTPTATLGPLRFATPQEVLKAKPCRTRQSLVRLWYCPEPPIEKVAGKQYCAKHAAQVRRDLSLERADWDD